MPVNAGLRILTKHIRVPPSLAVHYILGSSPVLGCATLVIMAQFFNNSSDEAVPDVINKFRIQIRSLAGVSTTTH